jgi:cobalt-zinc-cadmium efflux system outer membrane protein
MLLTATAFAQTLTLEEALQMAERQNPRLRVALAQTGGALAAITTARQYPNPEMFSSVGRQRAIQLNAVSGPHFHYDVTQTIDLPAQRRARLEVATLGLQSREWAQLEVVLEVQAAVKQAFYEVLRRQSEIELQRESLKLIEDVRRRIQVQVDVGEAARLELIRAESEVVTARTLANAAQLRLLNALAGLRAAIGGPLDPNVRLIGALSPAVTLPPIDELRRDFLTRNPGLAFRRTEVRRSNAVVENEKALRIPIPALRGEYEYIADNYYWRIGVNIPLPLWNRREGQIQEAVAALQQSESAAELRRNELVAALEQAYGLYQVATQQVASFQGGILQEAEAAVRAAEAAYRFGERGILDVLDAQRVLRSVRLDYLDAQYDRQEALIQLEQLRALESTSNNDPARSIPRSIP